MGCKGQRQVADFVQEERSALGRGDLADRVADRAGEGPLHVAEKLALQQLGGKAGAMDRDEGTRGPRAAGVDRAGQHALARAAFAADQDRGLGGGRLEGDVQGLAHLRLLGLQVDFGHDAADLLFQLLDVRLQPPHMGDAIQHVRSWSGVNGLGR